MDDVEVYANFNEKTLEETKKRAKEDAIDEDPNAKESKDNLLYGDAKLVVNEFYLDGNHDYLELNGDLYSPAKNLGYMSLKIPLCQELAIEIIERYLKKLGKLKTVLEATK
jgi:hypothetical protein